jgi:hypothetical protein
MPALQGLLEKSISPLQRTSAIRQGLKPLAGFRGQLTSMVIIT